MEGYGYILKVRLEILNRGHGGVEETDLAGSYLCSAASALNWFLCSSCKGGFSHFRCDLRKSAKALPLTSVQESAKRSF